VNINFSKLLAKLKEVAVYCKTDAQMGSVTTRVCPYGRPLKTYRLEKDMHMRNYDFTPLYRSTVGFDRLASMLDIALTADAGTNTYPPYNIEKAGEDKYRITVAVSGFSEDELNVEMREGQLVIAAKKAEIADDQITYLHRGIAQRSFEKRFQLADHVRPVGAESSEGLLHIDLLREVPEALKPRKIEIANASMINGKNTQKVTKSRAIEA